MTPQKLRSALHSWPWMVVLLALSMTLAGSLRASPPEKKNDKAASGAARSPDEQMRREAEKVIRPVELERESDDRWIKVERIDKPLLYYGDLTRENDRGSLWGWGRKGRPVALMELWQHVDNRTRWAFAICNTSGGKLRARRGSAPWWRENTSLTELKDVPGAAAPAAEATVRQRQMKLLAQKFSGYEIWDPNRSRYELRLLQRPLCTYRDEAGGLLDGGLFTLANGTNPEIMLFLEARVDPMNPSKRIWQYAVGRLAHAELHLKYDGKEVFEAPRGDRLSAPNRPYWLSFFSPIPDAEP